MQTTNDDQPTPLFRISSSSQISNNTNTPGLLDRELRYGSVGSIVPAKKRSFYATILPSWEGGGDDDDAAADDANEGAEDEDEEAKPSTHNGNIPLYYRGSSEGATSVPSQSQTHW